MAFDPPSHRRAKNLADYLALKVGKFVVPQPQLCAAVQQGMKGRQLGYFDLYCSHELYLANYLNGAHNFPRLRGEGGTATDEK
jgi:hypothetical protein